MTLSFRKQALAWIALPAIVGITVASTGGSPGGYSSAPGQNNCTSCHSSFALDSGPKSMAIGAPATTVGMASLPLTVTFASTSTFKHGFEIAARSAAGVKVGTMQITDATNTKLVSSSSNVTHKSAGAQLLAWSMAWAPPASPPPGPITFYVAGVEGNGGGSSGDYVYTAKTTVYQASISTPSAVWPLNTTQPLALAAPGHGGDGYIIAMSDSIAPTTLPGGLVIPVSLASPLFSIGITNPAIFQNFVGTLDPSGNASASVYIPPVPILSGFQLHFAFASVMPGVPVETEVSNRISVTIQ